MKPRLEPTLQLTACGVDFARNLYLYLFNGPGRQDVIGQVGRKGKAVIGDELPQLEPQPAIGSILTKTN